MSTVKISDLVAIATINSNTANTLLVGVDIPTGVTGKLTAHTLAQGLYSNEVLNVGARIVDLPDTIAQFSLNSASYIQTNLVNTDNGGSADFVVTANSGTDTTYFIDMGYANKDFNPGSEINSLGTSINRLDGYIYTQGSTSNTWGGNLVVGAVSTGKQIRFIAGGGAANAIVAKMSSSALTFNRNVVFADGTSQNTSSGSAGTAANSSFEKANSAGQYANSAFTAANSAGAFANSAADSASSALINAGVADTKAIVSGRYANGAFLQANAAFIVANTPPAIANSAAIYANAAFLQANTPSYTANSAALYANGAFLRANTPSAIANSAASYANGAFIQANAAYTKANSALANTSGTFDGNLSITGNLSLLNGSLSSSGNMTVNGTMVLTNTNFSATEAAITIKTTSNVATPSNDGYMLHISGKQNTASRIVFDSYGVTGNAYAVVAGRTARGTVDAPLPVANNDVLMRVSGNGRGNTSWSQFGVARMDIVATENYTDAARGSQIQFWNCAVGSNTLQQIATFNGDSVDFTGVVKPVKGFIYTPRIPAGNQTAITINYATDSMVKANLVADLTISHSNFIAGKVVEVWLVNTGGVGRTVTHGLTATNSTTNSTTFTIAGTSSAHLKFFSIDGDLANTFVSITYA